MMKKIYVGSWILWAIAVFGSISIRAVTPTGALVYSLLALGLVFTLMLWAVVVNNGKLKTNPQN